MLVRPHIDAPLDIADDRREKIFEWLRPTIPSASFEEALRKRLKETGMWFLTGAQYSAWKSTADSLLWIHGKRMFTDVLSDDYLKCFLSTS